MYSISTPGQRGYTLVEVAIAIAILSASILAWAQISSMLMRTTRIPEAQVSRDSLVTSVRETLRFGKTCTTAVVGAFNSSGFDSANILSGTKEMQLLLPGVFADGTPGDDLIGASTTYRNIEIESLRIVNAVNLGANKFLAQIQLRSKANQGGITLHPVEMGAFYFTVSGGAIQSCDSEATDPVPLCIEMGCNWDPAVTPSCQCDPIDLTCPSQHFVTGVDTTGKAMCTKLGSGPCPGGTYLKSLSIGYSDCVPLP